MYSVVNANPAYVLLAALDLLSGCEIQNSSGTSVSSPKLLSVFYRYFCQFFADTSVSFCRNFCPVFAEMAFTHVGAECVGGPWDFEGFLLAPKELL